MATQESRRLSIWGQMAPRNYTTNVLCFPKSDSPGTATDRDRYTTMHLKGTLNRLSEQHPEYAGDLHRGSTPEDEPFIYHRMPSGRTTAIPLSAEYWDKEPALTYQKLREDGFAASNFVCPDMTCNGDIPAHDAQERLPVAKVRIIYVVGGMLVIVYVHHSIADGGSFGTFLKDFAAATWTKLGDKIRPTPHNPFAFPSTVKRTFTRSLESNIDKNMVGFPEYTKVLLPFGPCQPSALRELTCAKIPRTGKIFVFKLDKLKELVSSIEFHEPSESTAKPPSTYSALAALTWAHVSNARQVEKYASAEARSRPAQFTNPVTWRGRVYKEEAEDYFGSSTVWATTVVETSKVLAAASEPSMMAYLVREVERANKEACTEEYVQKRHDMFSKLEDPRYVGLAFDPRPPQNLGYNTWRFNRGDVKWNIPMVTASQPDAIRRVQGQWNLGGALILPEKTGADEIELLLTLPQESMTRLSEDEMWMTWVDRVSE